MLKKLKIYIPLLLILLLPGIIKAQDKKDKIEAAKIAFITQQLNLSPQEAEKFWPIYNEEQDKLDAIKARRREFKKVREDLDHATDKEIDMFLASEVALKQREAEIMKEYNEHFKKVLSPRKVAKLYKAEDDFKKELLKQLKDK